MWSLSSIITYSDNTHLQFESRQDTTVSAAILVPAVSISDDIPHVLQRYAKKIYYCTQRLRVNQCGCA